MDKYNELHGVIVRGLDVKRTWVSGTVPKGRFLKMWTARINDRGGGHWQSHHMHSYQNKEPFQSFVLLSAAGGPDGLGREVGLDWVGSELERVALVLFKFELSGTEPESSGRKSPESSLVLPLSPPGVLVDRGLVKISWGTNCGGSSEGVDRVQVALRIVDAIAVVVSRH